MRFPHPFPQMPMIPDPEGYRDLHMSGVYYKWQHPLDLPIVSGSLHRQSYANRLPRCPVLQLNRDEEFWQI